MSKLDRLMIVDENTGEILENGIEVIESIQKEEYKNKKERLKKLIEEEPEKLSTQEIEEAVKIFKLKNIKEYESFDTYYTGNKEKLIIALECLTDQAFTCFSKLVAKFTSCENTIQYVSNHKNIVKDYNFAKALNISENKWRRIKKELINANCIRKIDFDKKKLYKINPMIIGHSMKITKCTYYAFRNQLIGDFSRVKIAYWDNKLLEEFGEEVLKESKSF